jgi:DNA replication protein DnaC
VCQDAGYLRVAAPVGHPQFGALVVCACRHPSHPDQAAAPRRARGTLAVLHAQTFAHFDPSIPGAAPALAQAQAYAADPNGWLLIEGGIGTGKTHLAAAIGHAALGRGTEVYFVEGADLLDQLQAAFDPGRACPDLAWWEGLRAVPLLIVDDMDAVSSFPRAQERFTQLLEARYARRMPTVLTTYGGWDTLDPRLVSRLRDARLVQLLRLAAEDYRRQPPPPDGR